MQTIRDKELLETLEGLDPWLHGLGIDPKNDRIHSAIEIVRKRHEGLAEMRRTAQPTKVEDVETFYFGLVEASEFHDIFTALDHENPETLGPRLKRALSGPLRPADETKENTDGRNTMFELALAAEWRLRGLEVRLGEPDIILTLKDVPFLVACKRPFREESIRPNVRGAARQLEKALERPGDQGSMGVIAVSVTRIFNRGDKLFIAPTEEGREKLGDQLQRLMQKTERHWVRLEHHPRIVAILFHIATPGVLEDKDMLVRMAYTTIMPIGKEGPAFNVLRETISLVYPF